MVLHHVWSAFTLPHGYALPSTDHHLLGPRGFTCGPVYLLTPFLDFQLHAWGWDSYQWVNEWTKEGTARWMRGCHRHGHVLCALFHIQMRAEGPREARGLGQVTAVGLLEIHAFPMP